MQKEIQGLYSFVIHRLPPTELGKELKAIGFVELHAKPLEGSLNAPTHKWTDEEDRLLLNAQLAIGNDEWNQIVLHHHLQGRTPFDVSNHWRQLIGLPKLSNSQRQQSGLTTLSKWTEDEDRILLKKYVSSGEDQLLIGENSSHWTFLSLKVAVYVYGKNIDGEHKIFDINTKRFFLVRDDIEQCLTALRMQSVWKEILEAVQDLMFENTVENRPTISQSNAKKRPPSSEFGNTMNSNPSNHDTAHQILCASVLQRRKFTLYPSIMTAHPKKYAS